MIHMHIINRMHGFVSSWGDDLVGNGAHTARKQWRRNYGKAAAVDCAICDFSMQRDAMRS